MNLCRWRCVVVVIVRVCEKVVSTNERLQHEAQAVLQVIENPEDAQSLRQDKIQNLQYLITSLYTMLVNSNFRTVQWATCIISAFSPHPWRELPLPIEEPASDIVASNWEVALEELNTLRGTIDSRATSSSTRSASFTHMARPLVSFRLLQPLSWPDTP
ncbi:hypothetical protein M378DRAFT_171492 [Amanita muscaria Koide BX008]|uniref:Eukaryotic translation initiation factor 3 subunit E N-terminal domain-containing protein n=1 Tax=Amanita muscaria (strain Koide BX008) TaxID=946122 RepID=A0A0C2W8Y9_AMAMK|nr:hypothetical protein M378DRAFT_171492 [Amanita muscaria Koide BX008]